MDNVHKTQTNKNVSIALTLPIACQICLGKVKKPVVCANQHVFCEDCLRMWLQRIQQCPTCRVPVTEQNPFRPIVGGTALHDEGETFSNRDLRKTRVELLFKEYEKEIGRLEKEASVLRDENVALHERLRTTVEKQKSSPGGTDDAVVAALTTKLKEAQKQASHAKREADKLKQEKHAVEDKNVELQREAQRLRLELTGRSPRKYGRTTVATLESQVETYEQQIKKLEKALEKSDSHIEHLENLLQEKSPPNKREKGSSGDEKHQSRYKSDEPSKKLEQRVRFEVNTYDELPSTLSGISDVDGDSRAKGTGDSTIDFELPSPINGKKVKNGGFTSDGNSMDFNSTLNESKDDSLFTLSMAASSAKKRLQFNEKRHISMDSEDEMNTSKDFNISMTPEMEACMRIFGEAEKKIQNRSNPETINTVTFSSGGIVTSKAVNFGSLDMNVDERPASTGSGLILSSSAASQMLPHSLHSHSEVSNNLALRGSIGQHSTSSGLSSSSMQSLPFSSAAMDYFKSQQLGDINNGVSTLKSRSGFGSLSNVTPVSCLHSSVNRNTDLLIATNRSDLLLSTSNRNPDLQSSNRNTDVLSSSSMRTNDLQQPPQLNFSEENVQNCHTAQSVLLRRMLSQPCNGGSQHQSLSQNDLTSFPSVNMSSANLDPNLAFSMSSAPSTSQFSGLSQASLPGTFKF